MELEPQKEKNVLILGGSNFVGKGLLQQLATQSNIKLFYINRGKKHWNHEVLNTKATYIYGNRDEGDDYTKLLTYITKKYQIKHWHYVVDFCCYQMKHIYPLESISNFIGLYIFISTDSIYDVCDLELRGNSGLINETMAVRPISKELYKKYKREEDYGHDKLKCEEYLKQIQAFKYTILRLSDVIGPYDDSGRFWGYIKWAQLTTSEIQIDQYAMTQPISMVFSLDIIQTIARIINLNIIDDIAGEAFNLACTESLTLHQIIVAITEALDIQPTLKNTQSGAIKFYPSVECGPLDVQKAQKMLKWNPTPLIEAIRKTALWFKEAAGKYKDEESYTDKKLLRKLQI